MRLYLNLGRRYLEWDYSKLQNQQSWYCIRQRGGMLPGIQGKWGQPGWGEWGRARPPKRRARYAVNYQQRRGQPPHGGPIGHRVRITNAFSVPYKCPLAMRVNIMNIIKPSCTVTSLSCLFICFRRINQMVINHLHSSSDVRHRRVWHRYILWW